MKTARDSFLRIALLGLLLAIPHGALAAASDVPELPRVFLDTTYSPPTGNTIVVNAGGNLQTAINNAQPGDTIVLQAGATFVGRFSLPNKGASTNWIYIRSSAYSSLPAPGNRVGPADVANMATIIPPAAVTPHVAITTQAGAHHYRFVGIELRPAPGVFTFGIVQIGNGESSVSQMPNNIVFDRCLIQGDPNIGGRRGIALNGTSLAVIDSHISDWKEVGADTQALAWWSTPGPLKIVNNYLEGAGENLISGGADPSVAGILPSDIEIRGNFVTKPIAWRQQSWTVKNLFELKNAQRVLVESNIFDTDWESSQDFPINFASINQSGTAPQSTVRDITFRHNIVRKAPNGFTICGGPDCGSSGGRNLSALGTRFLFQNNLFDDINSARWGGVGKLFATAGPVTDLIINHNTAIHNGSTFSGGDGGEGKNTGFEFTDNITQRGLYGIIGQNTGSNVPTLDRFFPGWVLQRNGLPGYASGEFPPTNFFSSGYAAVGFVDFSTGDYRLSASSPLRGAATDGKDVGADVSSLSAATSCTQTGLCGTPRPREAVAPFNFSQDVIGIAPNTVVDLAPITVTGTNFTLPTTISIKNGVYSVGCTGRYINTVGLISNGQTVCVRHTAAAAVEVSSTTTLKINGRSASFSSRTAAGLPPTEDADGDGLPNGVELLEGRNPLVKDNNVLSNARLFAMQQYRDFYSREGDPAGIAYWTNQVFSGASTRPQVTDSFVSSGEYQGTIAPVTRLYFAYFLRIPDYGGLTFWTGFYRAGNPLDWIANFFAQSPEFIATYGALNNTQFVTLIYQNVLGRTPDPGGFAFWKGELDSGRRTRGQVMLGFSESTEYRAAIASEVFVTSVYNGMLRRAPDSGGFSSWVASLDGGGTGLNMIQTIMNSTEYYNRFLPPI